MKKNPLWLWIGLRMSLLAVAAALVITGCMSLYFWVDELQTESTMTPEDHATYNAALTDIDANHAVLWRLIEKYYDLKEFLPGGADNSDWWALFTVVAGVLPLILVAGFVLSKPISAQFIRLADAARRVSEGDLSVRVMVQKHQPAEVKSLCSDFNKMVDKLGAYELEVKQSSSNLAHELRTPLNAALGRIQGMLDDVFPMAPEQLLLVQSQLTNLNTLVGDLHFLSLAHVGQLNMQTSAFCMSTLIDERLAWFSPQFEKAEMQVLTVLTQPLILEGDKGRLGQLVNILIENAIRYASDGKELTVAAFSENGFVCLEFLDRGHAVGEADLQNMFIRFWRAEQSRARVSGGGGLGLSIAEAISNAHGGKITAHRRLEGGLALRVTLPRHPPGNGG